MVASANSPGAATAVLSQPTETAQPGYVGLVTRSAAFVVDAAIITLVATIVGVGGGLVLAVLRLPAGVVTLIALIGAGVSVLWSIGYFVGFWSSATGQTPGDRLMEIRVQCANGERVSGRRALLRLAGVLLAAIPLFAGFLPILYDARRRGLQDYLARTVVVEAPSLPIAEARLAAKWERARRFGPTQLPPPPA